MRLAIAMLCVAACGGSEPEGRTAAPTAPEASPALRRPQPLPEAQPFALTTPDGYRLHGDLWPGDMRRPAIVLLHQLGSDRREWAPLVAKLHPLGAPILAMDLRGHAQSALRAGQLAHWRSFTEEDWAKLPDDLNRVLDELSARGARRFVLIGSSIGSSAALLTAAGRRDVAGVVALSPGRAYRGLDVLAPATELSAPLLAIAAEGEAPARETAEELARIAPAGQALIVHGSAHGVRMRAAAPDLDERIVAFVRRVSADG